MILTLSIGNGFRWVVILEEGIGVGVDGVMMGGVSVSMSMGLPLDAKHSIQDGALVEIGKLGPPGPTEQAARDLQDVVLRAGLLCVGRRGRLHGQRNKTKNTQAKTFA